MQKIKIFSIGFAFCLYFIYTGIIHTLGTVQNKSKLSVTALEGKSLWQKNNCTACHQIYGLGGYMGPDLTNIISKKGEAYTAALIKTALGAMPDFHLSDSEIAKIIEFLKFVDSSGNFPNHKIEFDKFGSYSIVKNPE